MIRILAPAAIFGQDGPDFHFRKAFTVRVLKKPIMALLAALIVSPLLGGCETVDSWTDGWRDGDVKVTNARASSDEPGMMIPPSAAKDTDDSDLKSMTRRLAGGSVEIYDLDDAAPGSSIGSVERIGGMPSAADGVAYPTDSSVTIYPLDGGMTGAPAWANEMSSPAIPISGGYNPGPSYGMTPPPTTFDDNTPLPTGKLSSVASKDVSRVYFPYGSARLDGSDKSVLRDVAETAKFAPVDRVSVEGHASSKTQTGDPITAKMLNLKESMNRAYEVSRELIDKGVPAEKIKTVGWGDTKQSSGSEPAQRRVDIVTAPGPGY